MANSHGKIGHVGKRSLPHDYGQISIAVKKQKKTEFFVYAAIITLISGCTHTKENQLKTSFRNIHGNFFNIYE